MHVSSLKWGEMYLDGVRTLCQESYLNLAFRQPILLSFCFVFDMLSSNESLGICTTYLCCLYRGRRYCRGQMGPLPRTSKNYFRDKYFCYSIGPHKNGKWPFPLFFLFLKTILSRTLQNLAPALGLYIIYKLILFNIFNKKLYIKSNIMCL